MLLAPKSLHICNQVWQGIGKDMTAILWYENGDYLVEALAGDAPS